MADGTDGRTRGQRAYRFYAGGTEVSLEAFLEAFLEAVARRGEATVTTTEVREPAYKLTKKGRAALGGAA